MYKEESLNFSKLIEVVERLRGKDGCPWDKEQDLKSIRRNIIEEAVEVIDAIEEENPEHIKEELGDLLFLIVFATEMAKEEGFFSYNDVIETAVSKLIYRHPHVFGNKKAHTKEEALDIWNKQKEKTKEEKPLRPKRLTFFSIIEKLKEIIPLIKEDGFDLIIGIKRGGIIPTSLLGYKLYLPFFFIEIRLYEDGPMPKRIYNRPKILDIPPIEIIKNRRILLVDDIENTGDTMNKAREAISPYAKKIKTFAILGKHTDYYLFPKEGCIRLPWF